MNHLLVIEPQNIVWVVLAVSVIIVPFAYVAFKFFAKFTKIEKVEIEGTIMHLSDDEVPFAFNTYQGDFTTSGVPSNYITAHEYSVEVKTSAGSVLIVISNEIYSTIRDVYKEGKSLIKISCKKIAWLAETRAIEIVSLA